MLTLALVAMLQQPTDFNAWLEALKARSVPPEGEEQKRLKREFKKFEEEHNPEYEKLKVWDKVDILCSLRSSEEIARDREEALEAKRIADERNAQRNQENALTAIFALIAVGVAGALAMWAFKHGRMAWPSSRFLRAWAVLSAAWLVSGILLMLATQPSDSHIGLALFILIVPPIAIGAIRLAFWKVVK